MNALIDFLRNWSENLFNGRVEKQRQSSKRNCDKTSWNGHLMKHNDFEKKKQVETQGKIERN